MFKKAFALFSFYTDYVVMVFMSWQFARFFLMPVVFEESFVGIGFYLFFGFLIMAVLALYAFILWNSNKILDKTFMLGFPKMHHHFGQSSFYYFCLIMGIYYSTVSLYMMALLILPLLITVLAIAVNAYFLYKRRYSFVL